MTISVSARLERVKEQMKLIGWHGNKKACLQGADLRMTSIFSEDLVRSEMGFSHHPGRLAPQGVERPVHAGAQWNL